MNMPIAHARLHNQAHRINQGIDSGALTQGETRQLRAEQREIRGEIRDARSDGQITCEERAGIRAHQNQASRDIFQAKHNCERRDPSEAPRVDRRQDRQQGRIANGIKDGSLTPGETIRLERMQGRIQRAEDRARADGDVNPMERARLEALQDLASSQIWLARHNSARRP